MNFIDEIVEKESSLPNIISKIKNSKLPLLLYGTGIIAKVMYKKLIENGVVIDGIVVSKEYHKEGQTFEGMDVNVYDETIVKYDKVNIFLTCILETELKYRLRIEEIYFFDGGGNDDDISLFNFKYENILSNLIEWDNLYNQLEDTDSRKTLAAFVNQKISGKPGFLDKVYVEKPYFIEEINSLLEEDEVFVDCGAYDGDTICDYIKNNPNGGEKIYAIEADNNNFVKLRSNIGHLEKCSLINKGVWSSKTTLYFNSNETSSSFLISGSIKVEVDTIDNILDGKKATFIKMDIEGSELEALKGAKETIINYRPKLAICVYHKPDDLLEIPKYIKSLSPQYKFYLRIHEKYLLRELVLYAIPI